MDTANIIRMFWHGSAPGLYEQLSIRSFLAQGHRVQVYAYGEYPLPAGAELVDAATVLPAARVFNYRRGPGAGSVAAFANLFRYKLLYEQGGTWADCDLFCRRSLKDLPPACVGRQDPDTVNNGVMRFPAGHQLPAALFEAAERLGTDLAWGDTGPQLLTRLLPDYPDVVVLPAKSFYPVPWRHTWQLLAPAQYQRCVNAVADSYTVHWWNEIIRRIGMPKDRLPPEGSWLERQAGLPDAPRWDVRHMATWIANHQQALPVSNLLQGKRRTTGLLTDSAQVCLDLGEHELALQLLAAAHQLRPDNNFLRISLARVLLAMGRPDEAMPHLQAGLADPATHAQARELQAGLS